MKKLLIILLLVSSLNAIEKDKFAHAFVGVGIYGLCLVTGGIIEEMGYDSKLNTTTCLIPVVVAGVGKELYDKQHPDKHTADWKDAAATMAIPLGMSVVLYKW